MASVARASHKTRGSIVPVRIFEEIHGVGYSMMRYVEFTLRTDAAAFIQCHLNAFRYNGGHPREDPLRQRRERGAPKGL